MTKQKEVSTSPKVSVVVPIYNVERYLKECVDSILAQTLKEIEVILIDDGSPDGCGKIIDEYAEKDPRVVPVHQKNSGYSATVNRGIEMARGEYIGIIESDDWIEPDMYESLYTNAKKNNTDVTKGNFYVYNSTLDEGNRDFVYKNPSGIDLRLAPSGVFTISEWPKLVGFHASIWSAIYRADFVKKIKIPETAGASYQDLPFMVDVMCRAKRITVVKKPFVHWRNDPNQGNSTQARGRKLLFMAENSKKAADIVEKAGLYNDLKEALWAQFVWANMDFFYLIEHKYQRSYYEIMHELFMKIKNDETFKYMYFRPIDMKFARAMMTPNYTLVYMRIIGSKIKHIFQRFILKFLPTYRTVTHLKEQIYVVEAQNDYLVEELRELKRLMKDGK